MRKNSGNDGQWNILGNYKKGTNGKKSIENIKPNSLVLLKENDVPPLNWRRGRMIHTIIGKDAKCRMVEVRTSTGVSIRSIHNVCPFPTEEIDKDKFDSTSPVESIRNNVSSNNDIVRRSVRLNQKNCIASLLLMLLVLPVMKSEINITNFQDKSGLFFENQGIVGLIRSNWNLVLYADMQYYWNFENEIRNEFAMMKRMEKMIGDSTT